jgi:excisionase family DNA binding protein
MSKKVLGGFLARKSERETMTEKEAAKALGLSLVTLWNLRKAGKLGYYKVGRRIMYSQKHLDEFLKSAEVKVGVRQ